jgi:hypothetical protein
MTKHATARAKDLLSSIAIYRSAGVHYGSIITYNHSDLDKAFSDGKKG